MTNVIIHVGTSHLLRDHPNLIAAKISKLLLYATKSFPNTSIYFSAILTKFKNTFFEMINHVNSEIIGYCSFCQQLDFIQLKDITKNHEINKKGFYKDMIHTSNNGLLELARNLIKLVRFLN